MNSSRYLAALAEEFLVKSAKKSFKYTVFPDGVAINGDCTDPEVFEFVKKYLGGKKITMMHTDPPYFVLPKTFQKDKVNWDQTDMSQQECSDWMKSWVKQWLPLMRTGATLYIWGGIGKNKFRPFLTFCSQIEHDPDVDLTIWDIHTWKKKRAIGSRRRFLFIREECVMLLNGSVEEPAIFNIPLTDQLRGYDGFSKQYKAKSPYLRRGNVWDITELFQGKWHPTQKPNTLITIPIEASSNKNDYVIDLFGGSFSTALTARELGRRFIIIEKDPTYYKNGIKKLKEKQ